jgi:hypothetical protein
VLLGKMAHDRLIGIRTVLGCIGVADALEGVAAAGLDSVEPSLLDRAAQAGMIEPNQGPNTGEIKAAWVKWSTCYRRDKLLARAIKSYCGKMAVSWPSAWESIEFCYPSSFDTLNFAHMHIQRFCLWIYLFRFVARSCALAMRLLTCIRLITSCAHVRSLALAMHFHITSCVHDQISCHSRFTIITLCARSDDQISHCLGYAHDHMCAPDNESPVLGSVLALSTWLSALALSAWLSALGYFSQRWLSELGLGA